MLTVTMGLKLQNLGLLEETLMRVSDPDSGTYGAHLSKSEVDALVAPRPETVSVVLSWLQEGGVDIQSITTSDKYGFLSFDAPVQLVEALLGAKYHTWTHEESGMEVTRCTSVALPAHVRGLVDFVGPTTRFPVPHVPLRVSSSSRQSPLRRKLLQLGGVITPDVIRKLYGVGDTKSTNQSNSQACASFLGQFMAPEDLQIFYKKFDPDSEGRKATLYGPNDPSQPGIEASLDIQYLSSMGAGVAETQFWSTPGQQPHNPENEPFLVWLQNVSALERPPLVISVSYGDNEPGVDFQYATRVGVAMQALGARGVSIFFSSGDGGVAGGQSSPCTDGKFIPTFPAALPFVTAVGGTASSKPEVAASFSSGGFSNYWPRPSYQDSAVQQYLQTASGIPPSSHWNSSGAGFPDISGQSESFNVIVGGSVAFGGVDGTSCSSPTVSGIFALLNDVRLNAGKPSLGYLNPLIYKHPEVFNDVVSGSNPGCGTNGFPAASGWDPVTGMGTPNFPKLVQLVKSLP